MRHGLGWRPDTPDIRDRIYSAARVAGLLPSSHNLLPNFPPVYDQGLLGSCVANAIAAVIEYNRKRDGQGQYRPSRLFTYYQTRLLEGTVLEDAGCTVRNAIKSVVKDGVCAEDHWPYNPNKFAQKPPEMCYRIAEKNVVTRYARVRQTHVHVRETLHAGDPVIFGFATYESFDGEEVERTGIVKVPGPGEVMWGGHAVVAIGYDDNAKMILCRNSYGRAWGLPKLPGHFRLPYDYFFNGMLADDLWTIQAVGG